MATIMFLRHAKSDWVTGVRDHDRPLNARGRLGAAAMGNFLALEQIKPEKVLCSTAVRAQQTLEIVTEASGRELEVQYEPDLYGADVRTILELVRSEAGDKESVLLVGHNPGFQEAAIFMATKGDSAQLDRIHQKYPTAGLCVISFSAATLKEALGTGGELEKFVSPKDLVE